MASYEQKRRLENIDELVANAEKTFTAQFRRDLPITIEEIAKRYATRRIDPFISPSIKPEIRKKMIESRLSDEEYLNTLILIIHDNFGIQHGNQTKKAFILAAQTGAGKTALRSEILKKYPEAIVINYDLYKKYRPDCDEIRNANPTYFGALTAIDSYDHGSDIMDMALDLNYDVLIESAPSSRDGLVNVNLEKMARAGYDLDFNILAVGNLISALGVHRRYEQAIKEGLPDAKLTDLARHDDSYKALESIVSDFSNKNLIKIYRRGTEEERRIPQQIIYAEGGEFDALFEERERSNVSFVTINADSQVSDFERNLRDILNLMNSRNCKKEEIQQLLEICKQYERFMRDRGIQIPSTKSKITFGRKDSSSEFEILP